MKRLSCMWLFAIIVKNQWKVSDLRFLWEVSNDESTMGTNEPEHEAGSIGCWYCWWSDPYGDGVFT
ncbi:hypothetical protein VIBNISO65_1180096 [Vibrio nigripulchritudo SO65]|nr:hypothetical protein VIBNISO65_1180096 [Vibrio nigripulchritudo SO65]